MFLFVGTRQDTFDRSRRKRKNRAQQLYYQRVTIEGRRFDRDLFMELYQSLFELPIGASLWDRIKRIFVGWREFSFDVVGNGKIFFLRLNRGPRIANKFCPVTAVAYELTGRDFDVNHIEAAKAIGLDVFDAADIAFDADANRGFLFR